MVRGEVKPGDGQGISQVCHLSRLRRLEVVKSCLILPIHADRSRAAARCRKGVVSTVLPHYVPV